ALLAWSDEFGVEEIGILYSGGRKSLQNFTGTGPGEISKSLRPPLYGAPFPHSEEEHRVFHVATAEFRRKRLPVEEPPGEYEIGPLAGGFFDGVVGELLTRSHNDQAPPAGVLITPTHLPGPDFDAAIRFLATLESVYDMFVDEGELRDRAEEMKQYYRELAERMQALQEGTHAQDRQEYPIDRMYM
ncbi:MAG: PAC2 family protein, partial [archaeon]